MTSRRRRLTVEIPESTFQRLTELADSLRLSGEAALVTMVLDHVDQGVTRPMSWERVWLEQLVGERAVNAAWLQWAAGEAQKDRS